MDLIGKSLGKYRVVKHIGAGGMGTVYKAYQPDLERYVAIKVLLTQQALTPGSKERFELEAKAIAKLSHPNILPIYDFGLEDGLSYFVMKYVSGQSLRNVLKGPLPLSIVSHYLDQIAAALDHAHQHSILHRDVKPANVLIEENWLLLADFGLVKLLENNADLTSPGAIMGSPRYISPEQVNSEPIDHRADIYSLGIMLYEMTTGELPFQKRMPDILFQHVTDPPPMPRELNPELSESIEQIILKTLAKNPDERYASAGQVARVFRDAIAVIVSEQTDATFVATPSNSLESSEDDQSFMTMKKDNNLMTNKRDTKNIATTAVGFLTSYLTSNGDAVSKKIGAEVYETLKIHFSTKPSTLELITDLEKTPGDTDLQAALRVQIKKMLLENEPVAVHLESLLQNRQEPESGVTIIKQDAGDNAKQFGQVFGDVTFGKNS